MRRLIPFEEWNKLKENIAFDGTKTEIGGALEVDGEAKINYLRSNVNYWNLEGEQGTLDEATFQALTLYNTDGIVNDNELYHLAHTAEQGVIVYSHISQDSQQAWNVKAITINENNKSWVKTTQAIGGGGGSLYQHNINLQVSYGGWTGPNGYVYINLLSTDSTTLDKNTFLNIINNKYNGVFNYLVCSGIQYSSSAVIIFFGINHNPNLNQSYLNGINVSSKSEINAPLNTSSIISFSDSVISL